MAGDAPTSSMAETFSRYFETVLCDTAQTLWLSQRLRYDVYCREYGYEREEDCPGGLEQDEYDTQAHHCLIRHRDSGAVAGCLRLVYSGSGAALDKIPIERHGAAALEGASIQPSCFPRAEICEISRIAVSRNFRRRAQETATPIGDLETATQDAADARSFPLLAAALFMAARAMVLSVNKPHVFAVMEPRLARMLERSGLCFRRLGPLVDYHGQRAGYYLHYTLQEHQASLAAPRDDLRDFFQAVEMQLAPQLAARPLPGSPASPA
ncbi:MAG: PEP-CTERM/exosortase system-associated acyltransferase [Immundisolibacter sp.]|uniref:PEP-CTERM/exosortase system-associated acyltransferase n=1 Tax=Immundisolibacter sp. TaxID=1934948 RepID=UPI003EDF0BE5